MAGYDVVVVSRGWWPLVKGGAERFAARVAEELASLGLRVAGVTIAPWRRRLLGGVTVYGVRAPRVPVLGSYLFSRLAAGLVNRLRPRAVLVNAYWGETAPLYIHREVRVVAVVHDLGLLHSPLARRQRLRHWLRMRALRGLARRADAFLVPTEPVARDLVEHFGVPWERVRVLGFEGIEAPMRRLHVENQWFDVVQVARFSPNKGQHVLLEAARILLGETQWARRELRVLLVGGLSDKSYYERLRRLAEELNRMAGRSVVELVADAESVDPYYRVADACVAASIAEEGYGLTVEECMGYGKPVAASDLFKELGRVDEETGYVFPRGDARALARVLERIHDNPQEALEKAMRGLEKVKDHTWRRVAEETRRLLFPEE